jgi:hypothetical protein
MFRNVVFIVVLFLAISMVPASRSVTAQYGMFTILPEDCRIQAGEELSLELSGSLPSKAVVTWDVDSGLVGSLLPGTHAVLVAPSTPSVITVHATISGTKPGRWIYVTRQCVVLSHDSISG